MEKWVAFFGLVLVAALGWVLRDAFHQEWTQYQRTYYRLALLEARSEAQREWARSQRLQVKQELPKELDTVERCVTCHVATDNPRFRDAAEPLRQHSDLLESHPPDKFGCVVCHGGEGRAVTTLEAHAGGRSVYKPLLRGEYIETACYNCHGFNTLPPEETAAIRRGMQLVNRYMCLGCHQIDGVGGEEGPDLSEVGSQRSWLWLYAHLARPQAMTVGSTMPVFALSREELRDITIYLLTLRKSSERVHYPAALEKTTTKFYSLKPADRNDGSKPRPGARGDVRYDSADLIYGVGCIVCHSIGRTGGQVGPALTNIGRKLSSDDLKRLLRNPEELLPDGKMPQLYLTEQEIDGLAGYLSKLR